MVSILSSKFKEINSLQNRAVKESWCPWWTVPENFLHLAFLTAGSLFYSTSWYFRTIGLNRWNVFIISFCVVFLKILMELCLVDFNDANRPEFPKLNFNVETGIWDTGTWIKQNYWVILNYTNSSFSWFLQLFTNI